MDTTFFNINAEKKGLLVGNFILPIPMTSEDRSQPIFYNISIEKQVVRMISLQVAGNLPEKVYIHVAETLNKRKQVMFEILLAELFPRILLTLFISIFLYRAVNRGLSPLNKLNNDIAQCSPNDLSSIEEPDVLDEVKVLTSTINGLFKKLSKAIESQQRLIANASHQLRTPLAGLKIQADRALRQTNIEDMKPALLQMPK